jgi:hypothetical protein
MSIKTTIFNCDCCGKDFESEISPYWPSPKNVCVMQFKDKIITLFYTKIAFSLENSDYSDYPIELKNHDYADFCLTCIESIGNALYERAGFSR